MKFYVLTYLVTILFKLFFTYVIYPLTCILLQLFEMADFEDLIEEGKHNDAVHLLKPTMNIEECLLQTLTLPQCWASTLQYFIKIKTGFQGKTNKYLKIHQHKEATKHEITLMLIFILVLLAVRNQNTLVPFTNTFLFTGRLAVAKPILLPVPVMKLKITYQYNIYRQAIRPLWAEGHGIYHTQKSNSCQRPSAGSITSGPEGLDAEWY